MVTNLGVLEPDESGELILTALHPGIEVEEVRKNTGWQLNTASELEITTPPHSQELSILREELDPGGIYLK